MNWNVIFSPSIPVLFWVWAVNMNVSVFPGEQSRCSLCRERLRSQHTHFGKWESKLQLKYHLHVSVRHVIWGLDDKFVCFDLWWVCCDLRHSQYREHRLCSPGNTLTFTFTAHSYSKPCGNVEYIRRIPKPVSSRTDLDSRAVLHMLQTGIAFVVLRWEHKKCSTVNCAYLARRRLILDELYQRNATWLQVNS